MMMRLKMYEVTLHFSGSETFYVEATSEEEAEELAHDDLCNMHELDGLEVTDCESHEDDDPQGLY
jgi:hypothetical protein